MQPERKSFENLRGGMPDYVGLQSIASVDSPVGN